MDTRLAGKVVLITGASGGIGRGVTEVFAAEGARLALQGHRQFEALETLAGERPWGADALLVHADVADPDQLEEAFTRVVDRWGRVDVCVANAGVWPPEDLPLQELGVDRVREVVEINLLGAVWTARAFMRALARTGPREDGDGAALVFTGSTAGRFGERGHVDYAVSKAGLYGLVNTLKNEIVAIDPRGRVNMVEPGWTVTSMARPALQDPANVERAATTMPLRQLGIAEDIASAIVYLSSPALARHVSGEVLTVAGGMEGRVLWERGEVDVEAVRADYRDRLGANES